MCAKIRNNGMIIATDWLFSKLIERNISELIIPGTVGKIRPYAFFNYPSLESVLIGEGVTSIDTNAFNACSGLTSISIPEGLKSIGTNAFYNCTSLKSLHLPDMIEIISTNAFQQSGIKDINIPKSLSKLTDGWAGMKALEQLHIPSNIKTISNNAFLNSSGLSQLTFDEDSVTSLGQTAFSGCTSLQEIKLPKSLTTLGYQAFQNCTGLRKVYIPSTTASIRDRTFYGCSALSYIFYEGASPIQQNKSDIFTNCNNIHLFDIRYFNEAKDKGSTNPFTSNNVYLYINVPDSLYSQFIDATICPKWSALNLKHFVHSCDVETFDDIANPQEGHYYSLKNDKNYLNPLGEKQIDIRQYVNGEWLEIDIDA